MAKAGRDEKSDGSLPTRHELKRKAEEVASGIESMLKAEQEGLAPQTVNQTVRKVLSTPFSLAWKQGLIPANLVAGMPPLKSVPFEKGVFGTEEVARMIKVASPD